MATKITNKRTDNPKLTARTLKDGRESLYLIYNFGYSIDEDKETAGGNKKLSVERKKENLNLYLIANPRTPVERQANNETLELAYKIKDERVQQFLEDREGYRLRLQAPNMLQYFADFVEQTKVADKRLLKGALENFKKFLAEDYPQFAKKIEPKQITPKLIQDFVYYLEDNHKGQGAETYYKRFKRLINYAIEKGMMAKSPCYGIKPAVAGDILAKDILSSDELKALFATHYAGENPEIRRAFAFTCLSGIRYCDVIRLTYSDVDYSNQTLTFRQHKVAKHSSKSGMTIPLNESLLHTIGEKPEGAKGSDLIFHLPSFTMCLKALRHWAAKAGIDKHITWHCGRHSFATIMLSKGANIKVVSELLGHSTLQHTQIYLRAVDKLKAEALNTLPQIDL